MFFFIVFEIKLEEILTLKYGNVFYFYNEPMRIELTFNSLFTKLNLINLNLIYIHCQCKVMLHIRLIIYQHIMYYV
jgi:hypothetical protein